MFPHAQPQRVRTRPGPSRASPLPNVMQKPVIPYDYAASFELRGIPGNIVQDVINISVDGVFVAVAIGYGFEEERGQTIEVPINSATTFKPGDVTLDKIPPELLITGFRLDPKLAPMVFPDQELPAD